MQLFQSKDTVITTDSSGDVTVYLETTINGFIEKIVYTSGDLDTLTDLVITGDTTGTAILTASNIGTSNITYHPRAIPHKVADGSAFTDVAVRIPLVNERIKVVVADGGDTKSGSILVVYDADN